jgi:cell division septal protein FtsQ
MERRLPRHAEDVMFVLARLSFWGIFLVVGVVGSLVVYVALVMWQSISDVLLSGARKRRLDRIVAEGLAESAAKGDQAERVPR